MNATLAIYILPLAILAAGIYTAANSGDPMWLVFAAVAAIATGFMARNFLRSRWKPFAGQQIAVKPVSA